ncbi:MAG: heme-binding protein [Verrucomicrobiota bacterium]
MKRACCARGKRLLGSLLPLFSLASTASAVEQLTLTDVQTILAQGVSYAVKNNPNAVLAVLDREGFVLGVWNVAGGTDPSEGVIAGAVSRGGTAAALSSKQNAFTSRTAGYIIQQHFPPGVRNTPPGPLVGVGLSNLYYSDVNRFKQIPAGFNPLVVATPFQSPGARAPGVSQTSLADSPGGVPLYKNGELVGGIGVTGDGSPSNLSPIAAVLDGETRLTSTLGFKSTRDLDEEVALAAQSGYRPSAGILATNVLLGGIRIPYVATELKRFPEPSGVQPLGTVGTEVAGYTVQASPALYPYESTTLGGVAGEIRQVIRPDPIAGKIGTANRLTEAEVRAILTLAAQRCATTRAGIRLPLGTRAKTFISVVNNPNADGVAPSVLGVFRVGEATMFSWDVSVQKARTALFFSSNQKAMSCRAVGFLAQRYFPPGLDGRPWGPLFGFQEAVSVAGAPGTGEHPGNPNLPNGITIFPGGLPLYRNGELVGAIGVSGDGVDQDDLITASGCANFLAPKSIRSDNFIYRGARLPYVKFPRNPED